MESQDTEPHPEAELELSLSQLPVQPLRPVVSAPLPSYPRMEAVSSRTAKQPRIEQRWHGNLQQDARALVILLQVGCVEPGTQEVTFEGSYEGLNEDQYFCMVRPIQGNTGHGRWLEGPVKPLTRADRADYVAKTIERILKFLKME